MTDGRGSIPQRTIRNKKTVKVHQITKDNYLSFMEAYGSQIGGVIQYRGSGIEIRVRDTKGGTMAVNFGDWIAVDDRNRGIYDLGPLGQWESISADQGRGSELVERVARLMYERTWGRGTLPVWDQAGESARGYWLLLAQEAVETVYDVTLDSIKEASHGTDASQA